MKKLVVVTIVCLLLLSMSTTSFSEKVVVVPLGKTVSGGIHVYDAADQYLGIFLGLADGFEIFVPAANSVLRLGHSNGINLNGSQMLFYSLSNCEGDAYIISGLAARLYENYFDPNYKYFTAPPITGGISVDVQSRRPQSYPAACVSYVDTVGNLVKVQHYTEEEVGISFPLTLPLRFEMTH